MEAPQEKYRPMSLKIGTNLAKSASFSLPNREGLVAPPGECG